MLIISGAMGAGRTTILSEVSDLLVEADVPHVVIDLDWLSGRIMHPAQLGFVLPPGPNYTPAAKTLKRLSQLPC